MSDWRLKQGPASFRGVQFFVDSGERSGGRQTVVHEYPFSESPAFVEDVGLKSRPFSVEGYVVGTEYEQAKNRLIDALETSGPGELVHPYFGTRRVAVKSFRVRETRADGGMAAFSIDFVETVSEAPAPVSQPSSEAAAAKVSAAKAAAVSAVLAAAPRATIGADISSVAAGVKAAMVTRMRGVLASLPVTPSALAGFTHLLSDRETVKFAQKRFLTEIIAGTLTETAYLAAEFDRAFDGFTAVIAEVSSTLAINPVALVLSIGDADFGLRPPSTTPTRITERANYDALVNYVRRLAITGASTLLLTRAFTSYEDAVTARDQVLEAIDRNTEEVTDDAFPQLNDLHGTLIDSVPGIDSDLPRLQTYAPPAVVSSLVLAHRLYGDLTLEADVVARNKVRHPGFVPAEPLEVLTDER